LPDVADAGLVSGDDDFRGPRLRHGDDGHLRRVAPGGAGGSGDLGLHGGVAFGNLLGARRRRHRSTSRVTGPSLWMMTSIIAPKRPVATVRPASRRPAMNASTSGSACSGGAAWLKEGRRPRLASP